MRFADQVCRVYAKPLHRSNEEVSNFIKANCSHGGHLKSKLSHVDRRACGGSCDREPNLFQQCESLARRNFAHRVAMDVNNVDSEGNDFSHKQIQLAANSGRLFHETCAESALPHRPGPTS